MLFLSPYIMLIGGWKTDTVFRPYDIVDEGDLEEAALPIERQEKLQLSHNQP